MMAKLPEIEKQTRQRMLAEIKTGTPLPKIIREVTESVDGFTPKPRRSSTDHRQSADGLSEGQRHLLVAGTQGPRHRRHLLHLCQRSLQGLRSLRHRLRRPHGAQDGAGDQEVNAEHETGTAFLNLLPDTSQKYLGLFNAANPADSKTATLRNMLMVRRNYDALVSGDGACAGCGEKSVLRSIAAVTEAYMRPVFHTKADRFVGKAGDLEKTGVAKLAALKAANPEEYATLRLAITHLILGLGGEQTEDTKSRIAAHEQPTAPSPMRSWSKRSPQCCSPKPSITRACSRSMDVWPMECL